MKRQVDVTKKSNIKCEHCEHYKDFKDLDYNCTKHKANKFYYQRCKDFEWAKRYLTDTDFWHSVTKEDWLKAHGL